MRILLLVFTILFSCIVNVSCTKVNNNSSGGIVSVDSADYRDKYIGDYFSTKLCTFWSLSQPQIDTVFNDTLTVSVIKHPTLIASIIVNGEVIEIDTSGSYTGYYNPASYKNYSISFYQDSISIGTFSGGLGGGTSCNTKGVK